MHFQPLDVKQNVLLRISLLKSFRNIQIGQNIYGDRCSVKLRGDVCHSGVWRSRASGHIGCPPAFPMNGMNGNVTEENVSWIPDYWGEMLGTYYYMDIGRPLEPVIT